MHSESSMDFRDCASRHVGHGSALVWVTRLSEERLDSRAGSRDGAGNEDDVHNGRHVRDTTGQQARPCGYRLLWESPRSAYNRSG